MPRSINLYCIPVNIILLVFHSMINRFRFSIVSIGLIAIACTVLLGATRSDAADMVIVEDGKARAVIVKNTEAGRVGALAAEELQRHIALMSGVRLPIVDYARWQDAEDHDIAIVLGLGDALGDVIIGENDLLPEGYRVATYPDRNMIVLAGRDAGNPLSGASLANREYEFGTLYAVYELLEQLGVRWYFPGELGTVIPTHGKVVIPQLDIRESPSFRMRNFWLSPQQPASWPTPDQWDENQKRQFSEHEQALRLWSLRNRAGNSLAYHVRHHSPTWWELWHKSHPEYLALSDGTRGWDAYPDRSKLCVSNPEVVQAVAELAKQAFRRSPGRASYSIAEQDGGGGFCECDNCIALDASADNGSSLSDRYVHFWNAVAQEVHAEFPDRFVGVYLYSRYIEPPQRVTQLHSGIHPVLVNNYTTDPARLKALVSGWGKLTDTPIAFYLLPLPGAEGMNLFSYPWASITGYQQRINELRKAGIAGYRAPAYAMNNNWIAVGPMHYLTAQLYWDANADVDRLLDQYCNDLFGQAASRMKQYYLMLEQAATGKGGYKHSAEHFGEEMPHQTLADAQNIFSKERVKALRDLLAEANDKANSEKAKQIIALHLMSLAYADADLRVSEALAEYQESHTSLQWEALKERIAQRDQILSGIPAFSGVINPNDLNYLSSKRGYNVELSDKNLVFNETFAEGSTKNWRRRKGFKATVADENAQDGYFARAASETEDIVLDRSAVVELGQSYKVQVRWRGAKDDRIRLRFVVNGKTAANAGFSVSQAGKWTDSAYTLKPPADASSVRIYLIYTPAKTDVQKANHADIDAISMRKIRSD